VHDNGTITLTTIDGYGHIFKANGHRVQLYCKPLTQESFYQQLREDSDMQILVEEEKSYSPLVHQVILLFLNFVHNSVFFFM